MLPSKRLLDEEGDELVEFGLVITLALAYSDCHETGGRDAVTGDEATHDGIGALLGYLLCLAGSGEFGNKTCDDDGCLRMLVHVFGYDFYLCVLRLADIDGVWSKEHTLV